MLRRVMFLQLKDVTQKLCTGLSSDGLLNVFFCTDAFTLSLGWALSALKKTSVANFRILTWMTTKNRLA